MTAKEYLISHLSDPFPEASSVQTRTALCAYAIRMNNEVDGYSLADAERLIMECGITDETFIKRCTDFLSNAMEAYKYVSRIPVLDD